MALCPNCKVEVGNSVRHCPLCHVMILSGDPLPFPHQSFPEQIIDPNDQSQLTPKEKRTIFLELYTICSLIAAIVVMAIDLLADRHLTWSLYPIASIACLWLLVCIPLILARHTWLILAVLGPSNLLFLLLVDAFDGRMEWFLPLGLPLGLLLEIAVVASGTLSVTARRKGMNIIAISLTAAVFVCVGVDLIVNWYLKNVLLISWSAIVVIAGIPLAGFLFFMHYRIVNRASLRKLFHL